MLNKAFRNLLVSKNGYPVKHAVAMNVSMCVVKAGHFIVDTFCTLREGDYDLRMFYSKVTIIQSTEYSKEAESIEKCF